jgi:LEA14-like dessication related protein
MSTSRSALLVFLAFVLLLFAGCATLQFREPIDVNLAGVEPLQGEGLEFRMLLKLRIQNPNDVPLNYNGVSIRMDVQGKRFAAGVSDVAGSIPRFGEAIIDVPVSISVFDIARQAVGVVRNEYRGKIPYKISGKLAGSTIDGVRFKSQGELTLPAELFESGR